MEFLLCFGLTIFFWLMCARLNYWYMVRHDWLRKIDYSTPKRNVHYTDCPDYYKSSHSSTRRCSKCGIGITDWNETRMVRAAISFGLGPFLLPLTIGAAVILLGQPVQREERDEMLKKAEADLEEANRKLDQLR